MGREKKIQNEDVSSLPAREMEGYRWKQRRIGKKWEIHVGDYGWRLIVGSLGNGS